MTQAPFSPRFLVLALASLAGAIGLGWWIGTIRKGDGGPTSPSALAGNLNQGEMLFQVFCASCHGPEGHGDGSSAAMLKPPPRDFGERPWRFAIEPAAIRKVILDGIPGTAMPASHDSLSSAQVDDLTSYVLHLATRQATYVRELTADEQLLKDAGFIDLRKTQPPALKLTDAQGKRIKLADCHGKLVLVDFWGTTCIHCLKEMPELRELEERYRDKSFTVLFVCADAEDGDSAQETANRISPGVRSFIDDTGLALAQFDVQALPASWLIGPDGKAIGRTLGARDWNSPATGKLLERWLPSPR